LPPAPVKVAALAAAVLWGAVLGRRILAGMGLRGGRAAAVMVPGLAAGLVVAAAWWPAIVG
jgi:hypothetical protein